MRRATAALLALAFVLWAAPVRGADSFRSSGRCTHLSVPVRVDAAAAAALIPDDFVLLEAGGEAVLALVTQDCVTAIDDRSATLSINSVVFVFVNPLLSPAGCETYDFFWTNSRNDAWHRAMTDIGIEEVLSPRATLRVGPGTTSVAEASNPYVKAPYAYAGTVLDTVTPPGPLPSVHCHVGPRGLVRQTYDHDFRAGGGVMDVTLGRSDLWVRLSAENTTTAALLARFTWTGVTEIVPT